MVSKNRARGVKVQTILILAAMMASCAGRELGVIEPEIDVVTEQTIVLHDDTLVAEFHQPEQVTDDLAGSCQCQCVKPCGHADGHHDELVELLDQIESESTTRGKAARDAVFEAGEDLVKYEGWQQMVKDMVELLSSPTLVLVQMPSGSFKKVKLEDVSDLDVGHTQIYTIKTQVSAKMKAALGAQMQSSGVPPGEAKAIASIVMDTFLASL